MIRNPSRVSDWSRSDWASAMDDLLRFKDTPAHDVLLHVISTRYDSLSPELESYTTPIDKLRYAQGARTAYSACRIVVEDAIELARKMCNRAGEK